MSTPDFQAATIIESAILLSAIEHSGVHTTVNPDGTVESDLLEFENYFASHEYTEEHKGYAQFLWHSPIDMKLHYALQCAVQNMVRNQNMKERV